MNGHSSLTEERAQPASITLADAAHADWALPPSAPESALLPASGALMMLSAVWWTPAESD